MAKKIYVGGLSFNTSTEDLKALFEGIGSVQSVNIITDRVTGRSRGFGFVEMGTDEEVKAAISSLNGKTLDERTITVNEARPQAPRAGGGGGGGGRGFGGGGGNRRDGGGRPNRW